MSFNLSMLLSGFFGYFAVYTLKINTATANRLFDMVDSHPYLRLQNEQVVRIATLHDTIQKGLCMYCFVIGLIALLFAELQSCDNGDNIQRFACGYVMPSVCNIFSEKKL